MVQTETEALGGDASKVMIGGFSQGGVLSLAVYLRYKEYDKPLGGVFSLSGMQGLEKGNYDASGTSRSQKTITKLRSDTPLFTYYGKADKSYKGAQATYKMLNDKVYRGKRENWTRFDVDDAEHKITLETLVELRKWLGPLQGMSQ